MIWAGMNPEGKFMLAACMIGIREFTVSGSFLRIFPWGAFFEKGPFCEIIY
jgi:hypothetical protein